MRLTDSTPPVPPGPLNTAVPSATDFKVSFSYVGLRYSPLLSSSFPFGRDLERKITDDVYMRRALLLFWLLSCPSMVREHVRVQAQPWSSAPGLFWHWVPRSQVLELLSERQRRAPFIHAKERGPLGVWIGEQSPLVNIWFFWMQFYLFGARVVHRWLVTRMLPNIGPAKPVWLNQRKSLLGRRGLLHGLGIFSVILSRWGPLALPTPRLPCKLSLFASWIHKK